MQTHHGASGQYPGWPITIKMQDNDGRQVFGALPELVFEGVADPVVPVISEADGEILYPVRIQGNRFRAPVFGPGKYLVKAGADQPDKWSSSTLTPADPSAAPIAVRWDSAGLTN